jgi:hypothetical protein
MALPASNAASTPQNQPDLLAQDSLVRARAALQAGAAKAALPQHRLGSGESLAALALSHNLALSHSGLNSLLPGGGLAWGQVTELSVAQPSQATSISLLACAQAQQEGQRTTGEMPWCAFVDPGASLYAPGVAQAGVALDHLLVLRPPVDALLRLTLRLVEARAFAVVVVDTCSFLAPPTSAGSFGVDLSKWVNVDLTHWVNGVRRLNGAVANTHSMVLLLTDKNARRPLPLPVATRLELSCPEPGLLTVQVAKDKQGRIRAGRSVAFMPSGLVQPVSELRQVSELRRDP